jgi:hypothetical protein
MTNQKPVPPPPPPPPRAPNTRTLKDEVPKKQTK